MEIVFKISKLLAAIMFLAATSFIGAIAGATVGAVIAPVKGFRFMFAESPHISEERPADKI